MWTESAQSPCAGSIWLARAGTPDPRVIDIDEIAIRRGHTFSHQRAVWDGVDKMLYALGAASPTRALSDGFDERVNAISDYVAAFKLQAGQVGVLYRIGGVLAGLDLFASERTFARAFAKLARGSALQALAGGYESSSST